MNRRTLIGVAVASTFGWTAAAHAAPSHETSWVATGDGHYPPMVMFEATGAELLAASSASSSEGVETPSRDAGISAPRHASAGDSSRAVKSRIKRFMASFSTPESEWVASGDERYPPMVMGEGVSTATLASTPSDTLDITPPDMLATTSTETIESVGSTVAVSPESVGAARPNEVPVDPNPSTGTDMLSGKDDRTPWPNPDAPGIASDSVYTETYVANWTPVTSGSWDVYFITVQPSEAARPAEPTNEKQSSTNNGDPVNMTLELIPLPSDFSGTGEQTAIPSVTKEDSPG